MHWNMKGHCTPAYFSFAHKDAGPADDQQAGLQTSVIFSITNMEESMLLTITYSCPLVYSNRYHVIAIPAVRLACHGYIYT